MYYNHGMSTLRSTLDQLLELQKLDSDRERNIRSLRSLDTGQAVAAAAQAAQVAASDAHREYQQNATALKDAELELAGLEKKLKTYEDRVRAGTITNSKELVSTEKEISQIVRLRSALDEKILGLMDTVELLKVKAAEADAEAAEADMRRSTALEASAAERSRLDNAIAELGRQREELAGLVDDKELLKKYDVIRARNNSSGIAIGRTQSNICGSCHMQVASISATRARAGEVLVICEVCGRIMA